MTTKLQVKAGDRTVTLDVAPTGPIAIDGVAYEVDEIRDGLFRVSSRDRTWMVAVAGPPDDRWVSIDGQVARVEVTSGATGRRKSRASGADALAAPMPATVVKLLVEPGAAVKHGDTLLVLEAMKMELALRAPRDAIVRAVNCKVGELVQPGIALLDLE